MPANFTSGMFVRYPAWHGLGVVVDEFPDTWEQARELGGMMWEPVAAPAFGFDGLDKDGNRTFDPKLAVAGDYVIIGSKQRIVRDDNGDTIGVPGAKWTLITHREIGEIVVALNKDPKIKYETLVVLEGGSAGAVVIRLDAPVQIKGDKSQTLPYLGLTWRHDGTGSVRAQSTSVRIVCGNTYAAAETEADRNGTVFVFRHGSNWRDRLAEAQEAIAGLNRDFTDYVNFANGLAEMKAGEAETVRFLERFIPKPQFAGTWSDTQLRHADEARATVRAILESVTCDGIRGSAFGLVQAGGEFLDHYQNLRNKETYMGRQILKPQARKLTLANIAREVCA